jgi:hypothetical protein
MHAVSTQVRTQPGRLDAWAYTLVFADLLAIAIWTWDFTAAGDAHIFDRESSFFAFGGVIILLGCFGVATLRRARHGHTRRPSMLCLRVSSALLLAPLAGYAAILWAANALASMP